MIIYLSLNSQKNTNMAQIPKQSCDICTQAPGIQYCLDCEQYYCDNCKVLHKRQKSSHSHEFQLATDIIPEVKSKCNDHGENLSLFCVTCDVPVCGRCVTGKHNGHKFSELHDCITKFREAISLKLQPNIGEFERNITLVASGLKKFECEIDNVITKIQEEGNRIKAMVDRFVMDIIKSVQDKTKQEKVKIEQALNTMNTELKSIKAMDVERKELEKIRPDGALVKKLQALQIDIDQIRPSKPPQLPSLTFAPGKGNTQDLRQLLGTFDLRFVIYTKIASYIFIKSRKDT